MRQFALDHKCAKIVLHHIFQRLGFTSRQTLVIICSFASLFAAFGIYGEAANLSEAFMFYSFIACFLVYATLLNYVWRITSFIRSRLGKAEEADLVQGQQ